MTKLNKILSIDGGVSEESFRDNFLVEMENSFNINVWDHFDMIAGTSTGGILASPTCVLMIKIQRNPNSILRRLWAFILKRG